MRTTLVVVAATTVFAGWGLTEAVVGQPAAASVTVLDTYSVWRLYQTLKPPVLDLDGGLTPVMTPLDWLNRDTPDVPAGWPQPDFDDTTWLRGSARSAAQTPYLARLCLRAKFEVTDPSQVGPLSLNLAYYGGAVVYVNGHEIARKNVVGSGKAELAEGYPPEAFLTEDGKIVPSGWVRERYKSAMAARRREFNDIAIPADKLRKGMNVIAVELVRSPYHKVVDEKKDTELNEQSRLNKGVPYDLSWNTCEMLGVQLTAQGASGLVPNVARPDGLQLWNSDILIPDFESDQGDRCEPLRPIAIKGARNGWFSGKIVVGSTEAIEGLKAVCSDLRQGNATVHASAVRIRYGYNWGGSVNRYSESVRGQAPLIDALLESPPATFPATRYGTVVPIWLTVRIPADARPGTYIGELTITAKDHPPRKVAVTLHVADWTLPNVEDRRTWVELIQSPDSLAAEYDLPLWSDRHWDMIAQSLRLIGEVGNRVAYVPLICHTNSGNEQSMVRFVKKTDGSWGFDFSVMDKYLDLVQQKMGRPVFTVFTAWEIYLQPPDKEVVINESDSDYVRMEKSWAAARWDLRDKGPAVTVVNPESGQVETVYLPRYETPQAKVIWKSLFDELHKRMAQRGIEDTMRLGMASDVWPSTEELTVLQEVSGNLEWVMHTHGGVSRIGRKMRGIADVSYIAYVWDVKYAPDPSEGRVYGWKMPGLMAQFRRFQALNTMSPSALMHFSELNITGYQRGLGRIGADFWASFKDKRGRRSGYVWSRYPQSLWHSLNLSSHMLVPGPDGPVASTRLEYLREGIQQCEARIAIERVLTDEALKAKLGQDLAKRCQDVLDERLREIWRAGSDMNLTGRDYASSKLTGDSYGGVAGHCWFAGSGWLDRTQQFYELAGEVTRKIDAR